MRILFIGGSGNISADCVELLIRRGHKVLVLTRGKSPVPTGATSITVDRYDRSAMQAALKNVTVDAAINFLGYDIPELETDYELLRGRVGQYIFISTAMVYAKPHIEIPVTEQSPTGNAFSDYAVKKLACEEWLRARHDPSSFPVTVVRPSHTYCRRWIPGVAGSASYTFAARLEAGKPVFVHGDGQSLWTLTSTRDFAVGLAGLVCNAAAIGESYHITSDEVLTWNQIYSEIAQAVGAPDPTVISIPVDFICGLAPEMIQKLKGDKASHGVFDNAKIKKAVPDYACGISFRAGIREAIRWFNDESSRKIVDPATDAIHETVIAEWLHSRR